MSDIKEFNVHVVGDVTGKTWSGAFEARKFLSSRQQLERDRVLRSYLGDNPQYSLVIDRAAKLADCWVGLAKSPEWWVANGNGLDLADDNLLETVYDHVVAIQKEARDAVKAKADAAKEALKADLAKPDAPDA